MQKISKKFIALLLSLTMIVTLVSNAIGIVSAEDGQPFSTNTQGSQNFRIPAIVTLDDGTLVAAADARWNTTVDAGGLDTIVSYSTDNGKTWGSTLANYLGDNGDKYNKSSTTFIDPALATDGKTVYMMVDLFPGGVALNSSESTPSIGTGYNANGYLMLKKSGESDYNYYLKDGKIYNNDGSQVTDYTVDGKYNLIENNKESSNIFYKNAPYQVFPTNYLYLTKSTDGGKTWSDPTILNGQVRTGNDMFYGVGPGTGLVLDDGTIMFPCYTYSNQYTSFIYSQDNGVTWERSENATSSWSSESVLVQINDTTVRSFYRDGNSTLYYTDYTYSNDTWNVGTPVNTGVTKTYNNQLSAIKYSKKIDGKNAVLVSTATGGSGNRTNGKVYTFTLNDDNTMNKAYEYSVTSGTFGYSSLTELNDGSIGLLYENASGSITYTNLAIANIASGAQIGNTPTDTTDSEDTFTEEKDVTLYVNQSTTITDSTGNYESSYTGNGLDESIATVDVKGTTVEGGTTKTLGSTVSMSSNGTYTGVISDGTNCLVLNDKTISSTTDINKATEWIITRSSSYGSATYTIKSGSYYLSYVYSYSNGYSLSASTTSSTWSYSNGFYFTFIRNYYLKTNNGNWELSTTSSNTGKLYSVTTTTTDPVDATTITLTGVVAGTTSVVVGKTKYNITVKEAPDFVDLNSTPFTSGTGQYQGKKVTKLTTSVNKEYDLNLNISGSKIEWSSGDEDIAKVDQNGKITGVAPGETTITCTVDGVSYTIPVVIVNDGYGGNYDYTCDIHISEISHTTVRYSLNLSTNLLDAQEGEAIYLGYSYPFCINFFGMEDEGYALTFMSSTNSAGNYYSLYEVNSLNELDAYNGGAIKNQYNSVGFNKDDVDTMLWYAINNGYHGTMGWTRTKTYTGSSIYSDLTFRSEKLPTVSKEVATVNGIAYQEGMVAHVGEKVVFNVTVTQYAAKDDITYSNVSLKDNLPNATFKGTSSSTQTVSGLSNNALSSNKIITYQVEYTITDADLDKTIENTVDLKYTYKAKYSSGSFGGSADASAKLTAASFVPQDIVIDFGLPVTIDYSGENAHGRYNLSSGTATYGDVSINNNKVTYTPNTVLKDADTVTLTNKANGTYTFKVYPATSVYYEESFATYTDNWNSNDKTNSNDETIKSQTASVVDDGEPYDLYGYDKSHNKVGNSSDTIKSTSTKMATAEFTFNGTGFDIYNLTTRTSGSVGIYLYDSDNKLKKTAFVNTSNTWLSDDEDGSNNKYFNTPIYGYDDLSLDTYTVKIYAYGDNEVSIDGFRVYNTQGSKYNDIYFKDNEDNPKTVEIRDVAIAGIENINLDEISDWYKYGDNIITEVYDKTAKNGAIILSTSTNDGTTTVVNEDMINNGPKNEIYLKANETIVMNVSNYESAKKIAVGLRNLNGNNVTYSINGNEASAIDSTVDMYYDITSSIKDNAGKLVITNNGDGVLALTKLKVTGLDDTSTASLASYVTNDVETVAFALRCMAAPSEPITADAKVNVNLKDYAGNVVATKAITTSGNVGESATVSSKDVISAVKEALPEGYAIADESKITNQEVAYGESVDVDVLVGKTATLTVKYKKLFSRNYETVTITKVQTSKDSSYKFTRKDVKEALPDYYVADLIINKTVKYGQSGNVTVTII